MRLADGEHLFRRYRARGKSDGRPAAYDLVAENPAWKTVSVTVADKAAILGTMVEHRRKRRNHTPKR